MADLIDRERLLKELYSDIYCKNTRFLNCVRLAPAVNRWIPCSERMPESRVAVIFTVNRGYPFVCVGYRINSERDGLKLKRWFCKLSKLNFSDYDVTAWMPMPEAYKEDDDDDT